MRDSNYNRLLRNQEKRKIPEIIFNRKRRFSGELGRNGTIMGMRNTIATLSNLIDSSCHTQSGAREGEGSTNSTNMERIGVVDSPNADHNMLERAGK
jgi:hypothetical protein